MLERDEHWSFVEKKTQECQRWLARFAGAPAKWLPTRSASAASKEQKACVSRFLRGLSPSRHAQRSLAGLRKSLFPNAGGVDYKTLTGTVTFPAGSAKAKIKVNPLPATTDAASVKVKLKLLSGTG